MLNQADGTGESSGFGIQSPNLFGLGAGRTLTLLNGRRMVTSAAGIGAGNGSGDNQVDANIIPLGLLEKVEVCQGGGAAVYGSDAIGGVVNYILKKDFRVWNWMLSPAFPRVEIIAPHRYAGRQAPILRVVGAILRLMSATLNRRH